MEGERKGLLDRDSGMLYNNMDLEPVYPGKIKEWSLL